MGTGVATELTVKGIQDEPAALILTSPYYDLKGVLNGRPCGCCRMSCFQVNHFNTGSLIGKTKCPVHLIHGDQDKVILHDHSKRLYAAR
jgi:alpha-beta hydrolase superfamily lysophospholipase